MPKKCAVVGCSTNRYHFEHGIRFYHVPREDEDLKIRWLGAIGRSTEWKIPTVPIVCEKHFVHEEQLSARNLAPNVVPTLNLPSPEGGQSGQLSLKQVKSTKTSVKRKTKRTTKDRTIPEPEVVLVPTVVAISNDCYESCCRFCSDKLKVTGRLSVTSLRQSGLVRDAIWDLCWPSESLIAEDDGFSICNVCWLKMQEFDHFVRICHQQQETLPRISGAKSVKDELVQDQPSESELSHSETGILFTEPQISNPEDVEHTSVLRVEQSNSELPSLEGLTIDEMLEVLDKIPVPRKKYNQLNEDEECWDCGKMFPNRSQKKEHRKTCPAIGTAESLRHKSHACEICAKQFDSRHGYRIVTTTHENPKFSCTECEFVCDKLNQLASHKKKHKRMKRERTGTKGKSKCSISIEEGDLQDHQTSDSVDKPKSYSYASYSDGSDENAHTNDETDSVVLHCSECSYTCTRPIQLASHKKKHTGYQHKRAEWEEKRKVKDIYECEFCDFKCKLRRQMAGHRASHSELIRQSKPSGKEREHMCSICGKILSTRGAFFVHMKYHNDQRDYPCNLCGKKFYSKRDVTMHVESLHEKKVYECEICGVKCTWKNALSKHMRKHDSKSYKLECSYCGKRFMAANELRLHVWRHTGQQLSCDICGAGYRFNFLLTQHKIRAHGIEVEGVKLYNRFKKDKMSSGKRTSHKSNQPSHDSAPTECIPDATSSSEAHEQPTRQAPVEDTTSYPANGSTGNYSHLMVPSSHVAAPGLDPHVPVPFHPLGSVMGQSMPPEASQSNIFHQVDNY
ncbi:zinc finger protein ZFP2 [Aedes albopictus]|uniref:C2h2-type zn-finger protein n=1 Tax=Aedes albopictus TaxID=7160 RepID=A0ABM1XVY9_AEDAL